MINSLSRVLCKIWITYKTTQTRMTRFFTLSSRCIIKARRTTLSKIWTLRVLNPAFLRWITKSFIHKFNWILITTTTIRPLSRKRRVTTRFLKEAKRRIKLAKAEVLAHRSQTITGMKSKICLGRLILVRWNATVKALTITNLTSSSIAMVNLAEDSKQLIPRLTLLKVFRTELSLTKISLIEENLRARISNEFLIKDPIMATRMRTVFQIMLSLVERVEVMHMLEVLVTVSVKVSNLGKVLVAKEIPMMPIPATSHMMTRSPKSNTTSSSLKKIQIKNLKSSTARFMISPPRKSDQSSCKSTSQ